MGVAGSAWNVQLVPLRALDRSGVGTVSNIAWAVLAAANRHVDVINLSLTLSGPSTTLHERDRGRESTTISCRRGQRQQFAAWSEPAPVRYPAAYPEVIAVAATTRWEERAAYSNGGPEVELAAPGGEASDPVISTSLDGSYAMLTAPPSPPPTSPARPRCCAATRRSGARQAVRDALRNTADKVGCNVLRRRPQRLAGLWPR